jgi:hypothetical protein
MPCRASMRRPCSRPCARSCLGWIQTPWLASIPSSWCRAALCRPCYQGGARLLLRVASRRMDELVALAGLELKVAGQTLRLGVPHRHDLQPHSTLYAYRVAADSADEVTFMAAVAAELAQMAIGGERVCGKHQAMGSRWTLAGHFQPDAACVACGAVPALAGTRFAIPPSDGMRDIRASQVGCGGGHIVF